MVGGDVYDVVTINNKTGGPINYSYRWGNGEWRDDQIYPDKLWGYPHKYKFVNEHKSPSFEVRFDRNVSQTATWIVYSLKRNPSPKEIPLSATNMTSNNLMVVISFSRNVEGGTAFPSRPFTPAGPDPTPA